MYETTAIILSLFILLVLLLAFMGMWTSTTDKPSDYELYGMDAEEYLKKQMGE